MGALAFWPLWPFALSLDGGILSCPFSSCLVFDLEWRSLLSAASS